MNHFLLPALAFLLAVPALAQDEVDAPDPWTVQVSYHQCDWTALTDDFVARERERMLPIAQAVKDEDPAYRGYGMAMHLWGDEYNLITWNVADDIPAMLAAAETVGERYNQAYPDDASFLDVCPSHHDVFYRGVDYYENEAEEDAAGSILSIGYYQCAFPALGGLVDFYRSDAQPLAREVVDQGLMRSEGLFVHDYGDRWTMLVVREHDDMRALLDARDAMARLGAERMPEDAPSPFTMGCSAHKDNIYQVVLQTD